MAIEQEWKNPKKRNRNIVIGIAIILLIWWFCGFGGSKPWLVDLNNQLGDYACPDHCWVANNTSSGGGGSSGGGITSHGTCPPLGSKLRAADPSIMVAANTWCISGGPTARWTENDVEVSCEDGSSRIDCDILSSNPQWQQLVYDAHLMGAVYHCQSDWAGIYCPGNGPAPYDSPRTCGKTVTWGSDYSDQPESSCYGACSKTGDTCQDYQGECYCLQPQGGQEGGNEPEMEYCHNDGTEIAPVCGGYCSIPGQECMYVKPYEGAYYMCLCTYAPN